MLGEVGGTADLIMQAASRFFVDDAKQMVEFTYAGVVQRNYNAYLSTHKATNDIRNEMTAPRGTVLTNTYWTILPCNIANDIAQYSIHPSQPPPKVAPEPPQT